MKKKTKEVDKFGRHYPPKLGKYHVPVLCTDALVLKLKGNEYEILLIERGHEPFTGKLALPGGHVDYDEDPMVGCLRELKEETGLKGENC